MWRVVVVVGWKYYDDVWAISKEDYGLELKTAMLFVIVVHAFAGTVPVTRKPSQHPYLLPEPSPMESW